jgi:hypothetical protein
MYNFLFLQSLDDVLSKGMRLFYMPDTSEATYIQSQFEHGSAGYQMASAAVQNEQYVNTPEDIRELFRGAIH